MANIFEKSINLGLGLFIYSREKVEAVVEELVNKGDLAKKDAQQFTVELIKKGDEQKQELKKLIREEISSTLGNIGGSKNQEFITRDNLREMIREEVLCILEAEKNKET